MDDSNKKRSEFYNENFYRRQKNSSYKSAEVILPLVMKYIQPNNVIDVGCGVGTWLAVWQKLGAKVYGIDGAYVDRKQLLIDEKFFHPANLEERINLDIDEKFNLAMSLEVAEHLTINRAETFVEDLIKLSDVVLFSAAVVGQGGTNHINEQMQSYWVSKFAHHGYVCIDCIRPKVWQDNRVKFWYKQNVLLYVNYEVLHKYPDLKIFYLENKNTIIYDLVHPEMWINTLMDFKNAFMNLTKQLDNK